ncbi:MAG: cation:proton antiporter [Thermoanaerobaculales bacterium]|nr:cation:proton antiporter [Thermoanaerobaculales bacterium]
MHGVLADLVVVMAASVGAALVLRRLRLPPVVGFLVAGILVGPGGIGLVTDRRLIEGVAEIGVMLLLFTVGLKLKIGELWRMRGTVFGSGTLQVLSTGAAAGAVAVAAGRPAAEAAAWGMVVALSSTALVLWLLEGSGKTSSAHGRAMIGVLLLQDLAVVPIMLSLPLLAGHGGDPRQIVWFLARAIGVIVLTVVGARVLFPALAERVVAAGSRELFTLTTVLVAVGTAMVFGHFGLSVALGAFLAGMVVSESRYVSRMVDEITPLRDVFNSLFFVSLGMLVDPQVWLARPALSAGLIALVVLGKAALAAVSTWPSVRDLRVAAAVGLGLAQIGEFSLVVAAEAGRLGLIAGSAYELFLAIAVPTMLLTPGLTFLAHRIAARAVGIAADVGLADHMVIVGYGVNGRNVHQALSAIGVPHAIVDLNPHTVTELREAGENAVFGNAEEEAVLRAAAVGRARGVIVAIPDAASTRQVVAAARRLAPGATVIARTRYVQEVEALEALGADQVIPEEFETSLELTGRVLEMYGAPSSAILEHKSALRRRHYGALRAAHRAERSDPALEELRDHLHLTEIEIADGAAAVGRSLRELAVRRATGATVLAVRRSAGVEANPSPDTVLGAGDRVVIMTDAACEDRVRRLLGGGLTADDG